MLQFQLQVVAPESVVKQCRDYKQCSYFYCRFPDIVFLDNFNGLINERVVFFYKSIIPGGQKKVFIKDFAFNNYVVNL